MQLNTLAGRSYNDITQVDFSQKLSLSVSMDKFCGTISKVFSSCSIQFSLGFFLTTVQRVWILMILLLIEIFQRWLHLNISSNHSRISPFLLSLRPCILAACGGIEH